MTSLIRSIKIARKSNGNYEYISKTYTNLDMSECELIIHLGAVLAVNLTKPEYSDSLFEITLKKYKKFD